MDLATTAKPLLRANGACNNDDPLRSWSPRSGVTGLTRKHAEVDADFLEGFLVFTLGILTEDQLGIGGAMQPTIMLDLVLQLARRPAGIAQRQDGAARSAAARDRLENVESCGEADALVDRQGRVLDHEVARVQHEAALGIDRAALEHLDAADPPGELDQVRRRDDLELHQEIAVDVIGAGIQLGVLLNPVRPDIVRMMPPLTITEDEVDQGVDLLEAALQQVIGG